MWDMTNHPALLGVFDAWTETYSYRDIPDSLLNVGQYTTLWIGGVLVDDHKVVFVPFGNTGTGIHVGIFDVLANNLDTVDITTLIPHSVGHDAGLFHSGVLACDGTVVFVPNYGHQSIGIFEVNSRSFDTFDISAKNVKGGGYVGGVLLPSCKIVLVPGSSDNIGIFDPSTNNFDIKDISSVLSGSRLFIRGVLTPGGHVILSPHYDLTKGNPGYIGVFNPSTEEFRVVDISDKIQSGGSGGGYYGAVLLPNGNILHIPYSSGEIGIFNPSTESFHVEKWKSHGEVGFGGGTVTKNGKVVMSPLNGKIGVYDLADQDPLYTVEGGVPESWKVLLSPHLNT